MTTVFILNDRNWNLYFSDTKNGFNHLERIKRGWCVFFMQVSHGLSQNVLIRKPCHGLPSFLVILSSHQALNNTILRKLNHLRKNCRMTIRSFLHIKNKKKEAILTSYLMCNKGSSAFVLKAKLLWVIRADDFWANVMPVLLTSWSCRTKTDNLKNESALVSTPSDT